VSEVQWEDLVVRHITRHIETLSEALKASDYQKDRKKERYDLGVHEKAFIPGQLVMLYDPKSAKKKLSPA
jgi:hypothetical protein